MDSYLCYPWYILSDRNPKYTAILHVIDDEDVHYIKALKGGYGHFRKLIKSLSKISENFYRDKSTMNSFIYR